MLPFVYIFLWFTSASAYNIQLNSTLNQSLLNAAYGLESKTPASTEYDSSLGVLTTKIPFKIPLPHSPIEEISLRYSSKIYRNKGMGVGFDWSLPKVENRCTKKACSTFIHYNGTVKRVVKVDNDLYREEALEHFFTYKPGFLKTSNGITWSFLNSGLPYLVENQAGNSIRFVWSENLLIGMELFNNSPFVYDRKKTITLNYEDCKFISNIQPPFIMDGFLYDPNKCLQRITINNDDQYFFEYASHEARNLKSPGRYLQRVYKEGTLFNIFRAEYTHTSNYPKAQENFCPKSRFQLSDHLLSSNDNLTPISDVELIRQLGLSTSQAFYNWEKETIINPRLKSVAPQYVYNLTVVDLNNDGISDVIAFPVKQKPIIFWGRGSRYERASLDDLANLFNYSTPSTFSTTQLGDFNGDEKIDLLSCSSTNSTPTIIYNGGRSNSNWQPDSPLKIICGENQFVVDFNGDGYDDVILNDGLIIGGPTPEFIHKYDKKYSRVHSALLRNMSSFVYKSDSGYSSYISLKEDFLAFSKSRRGIWRLSDDYGYTLFDDRIIRTEKTKDKSGYFSIHSNGECSSDPLVLDYGIISTLHTPLKGQIAFSYLHSHEGIQLRNERRHSTTSLTNSYSYSFHKPNYNKDNEFLGYELTQKRTSEIIHNSAKKQGSVELNYYALDREAESQNRLPIIGKVKTRLICPATGCISDPKPNWIQKTDVNWTTLKVDSLPSGQQTVFSYPSSNHSAISLGNRTDIFKTDISYSNMSIFGPLQRLTTRSNSLDNFKSIEFTGEDKVIVNERLRPKKEFWKRADQSRQIDYAYEPQQQGGLTVKKFVDRELESTTTFNGFQQPISHINKFGLTTKYSYPFYSNGYPSVEITDGEKGEFKKFDAYGNVVYYLIQSRYDNIEIKIERDSSQLPITSHINGHVLKFDRNFENGTYIEQIRFNDNLIQSNSFDGFGNLTLETKPSDLSERTESFKQISDTTGLPFEQTAPTYVAFQYNELGKTTLKDQGDIKEHILWAGSCAHHQQQGEFSSYNLYSACQNDQSLTQAISSAEQGQIQTLRTGELINTILYSKNNSTLQFSYESANSPAKATLDGQTIHHRKLDLARKIVDLDSLGTQQLDGNGNVIKESNSSGTSERMYKHSGHIIEERNDYFTTINNYNLFNMPYQATHYVNQAPSKNINIKYNKVFQPVELDIDNFNLKFKWNASTLESIYPIIQHLKYDTNQRVEMVRFSDGLTFEFEYSKNGYRQTRLSAYKTRNLLHENFKWDGILLKKRETSVSGRLSSESYDFNKQGLLQSKPPLKKTPVNAKIQQNRVISVDGKSIIYGVNGAIIGIKELNSRSNSISELYLSSDTHYVNNKYIHYIYVHGKMIGALIKDSSKKQKEIDQTIDPWAKPSSTDEAEGFEFYPILTDQVGSVIGIFNSRGELIAYRNYSVWGELTQNDELSPEGKTVNSLIRYDFAGLIRPQGQNFLLSQKRIYDPQERKWMTFDPSLLSNPSAFIAKYPQEVDGRSYARGNPLYFSDPSGEFAIAFAVPIAIGSFTGGVSGYLTAIATNQPTGPAVLKGAIAGAIAGGTTGLFGITARVMATGGQVFIPQVMGGALGGFKGSIISQAVVSDKIDVGEATLSAITSSLASTINWFSGNNFTSEVFTNTFSMSYELLWNTQSFKHERMKNEN